MDWDRKPFSARESMYDMVIENGWILDGSGNPCFRGDMGIQNGKIVQIGLLRGMNAKQKIDAQGRVVAPGFIDIHCHSDAVPFVSPREEGRILQGITTETIGNCGVSLAPIAAATKEMLKKYVGPFCCEAPLAWNWQTMGELLHRLEERKNFTNIASWVGHGTVRIAVLGMENRKPTAGELSQMKKLVLQALEEGAFGLSSGLIYPPGVYSETAEMIELCKEVAEKGGVYTTHMRNEHDLVLEAVEETIEVAEKSRVSTIIAHHKTAGKRNWGKSRQTLKLIEEARGRGMDIVCDAYPYEAGSTFLWAVLPPWAQEGGIGKMLERLRNLQDRKRMKENFVHGLPGWANLVEGSGWDGILVSSCPKNKGLEGRTVQEIADSRHVDPPDALFDILLEEDADVLMVIFGQAEDDVTYILTHPVVMVGSDAIPSAGKPHPRFFGTFPRILGKYVREERRLSLPDAVRKMTSMPAQRLGLADRGMIKVGMWADIVIFDPATIGDAATYADPRQYPTGISYVLVNGQIAVRHGKTTGALGGKVLRKKPS
jgi:N-acyl-D-aspartate/D-glutamate deacylase